MEYAQIVAGAVAQKILADAEFIAQLPGQWVDCTGKECGVGWAYDGETFTPPASPEPAPIPRHITQLGFINRFTDAEAIALDLASIGATIEAATLRRYLAKVQAARFIDLDDEATVAGVQALEAGGLLATGRSAIILGSTIQDREKP